MDIAAWLRSLGLDEYAAAFTRNRIDGQVLRQLTEKDLEALGVRALGDRKRLLNAIGALDRVDARAGAAPSPLAYTPDHLAERILRSRHALEGERKHVTVLFADIKGSTALIEDLDPEEAAGRLSPALSAMMAAVHRYEGTVNRVQGDGIMALFGAPLAHEDHAVRACLAALAMREALGEAPAVRIGLHCGEVLVRAIHNDLSMDYDVVGATAHLASRMEQSAAPGTIRITGAVRTLAAGYVRTRSLGMVAIKGMRRPVEVHEVTGRSPLRTRWEARSARELTALAGRNRELEALMAATRSTGSGQGQLVALVGDAGMGKSRLVHEFTRRPELEGWRVLRTGALPHHATTPYLPVGMLLRDMFQVEDVDDHATIDVKLRAGLAEFDADVAGLMPMVQSLMDLPVSDPLWMAMEPTQRAERIIEGSRRLLLRGLQTQPVVLVFEDLHWIDGESQRILDALVDAMGAHALLLLVTHRPEYRHDWAQKSFYTRVRIDPLEVTPAREMLDTLIGVAGELDPLKRVLIERTGGRPLFIEETVRSLVEAGVLREHDGTLRFEGDAGAIEIPESVQDVLAARIDRLAPELKGLLQSASVIGRRVPARLLRAIENAPDETLFARLAELQRSEFLYQLETSEDRAYLFKHVLTEEVAYASLTHETRQRLHGRLVDAIESEYAGRLEEHVEELGRHAVRAQRWDKAFAYNRAAAKKAHGRSAYVAAIERFEDALAALEHLPGDQTHLADRMDIRLEMRAALWPLGRHDHLERRVREAGQLAEQAGDVARLANVHNYLTAHYWQAGDHRRAIEHGEKGLALAKHAGDFSVRVTTMQHLGIAFNACGDFRRQVALHREVAAELTGPAAYGHHGMAGVPAAITRGYLAWGLTELGRFEEALRWAGEGMDIARETNSAMSRIWVTDYLALTCLRQGEVERALDLLEPNLELCRRAEVRLLLSLTCGLLGLAHSAAGRCSDAIPLLEEAVSADSLHHHPEGSGYPFVWLAQGYARAGRCAEARDAVARALATARTQGERGHEAWARFTEAQIETVAGASIATVAGRYRRAEALAGRCGMAPLVQLCRAALER